MNNNSDTTETLAETLLEGMAQFHGSDIIYLLPICGTHYTEGVQFIAETADAFWLLTDTSIMGKSLMEKSKFLTIDFKRLNSAEKEEIGYDATVSYSDGNGQLFTVQKYHTDFPLESLRLYFIDGTLLLPNEY